MATKQRVVITGAGTGIGRACAHRFAKDGAELLLIGRRRGPLEKVYDELSENLVEIASVDCAEQSAVTNAINKFGDKGGINVLVANAGINPQRANALDTDADKWWETLEVNIGGVHYCCQAALPHMLQNAANPERGAIVTVGSIAGMAGMKERAAYGPSKAAVINYTKALAIDFGKQGVRANCVCPGFVVTDINRDWLDSLASNVRQEIEQRHVLGLGNPEAVAEAFLFFASPAASWITGVELAVDGGWRAS